MPRPLDLNDDASLLWVDTEALKQEGAVALYLRLGGHLTSPGPGSQKEPNVSWIEMGSKPCDTAALALVLSSDVLTADQVKPWLTLLAQEWKLAASSPEQKHTHTKSLGLALAEWVYQNPLVFSTRVGLVGRPMVCFGENQPLLLAIQFNAGKSAYLVQWLGNATPLVKQGTTLANLLSTLGIGPADQATRVNPDALLSGTEWTTAQTITLDANGVIASDSIGHEQVRRVTLLGLPEDGPASDLPASGLVKLLDLDSHEVVWASANSLRPVPDLSELAECVPEKHQRLLELMKLAASTKVGKAAGGPLVLGFFGPTGSGKSLLAKHLASAIGLPLLRIGPADLLGGAQAMAIKIREAFRLARWASMGLLLDDIEMFLDSAGLHQLQEQLDQHTGVVLVTSADAEELPNSFLSRVTLSAKLDARDPQQRQAVWALALRQLDLQADEDVVQALSRFEISLRTIRNLAGLVSRMAPGQALTMNDLKDFEHAIRFAIPYASSQSSATEPRLADESTGVDAAPGAAVR